MKVKELIEELQKLDPELDVILQKDEEGNGFNLCGGVEETMLNDNDEALHSDDYEEYGVRKGVVIYP